MIIEATQLMEYRCYIASLLLIGVLIKIFKCSFYVKVRIEKIE